MRFFKTVVNLFRFDRTNWKAVALCFGAATVFWLFNALNQEHTATLTYPITFRFDQVQFIASERLPEKVALNITGSGWDLLRKSLGYRIEPLVIALERPSETKKIPPATILPIAAVQLNNAKINHVASDTLLVNIEPRRKKMVALALNPRLIRFELGYGLASHINITPDSVLMTGPQSTIKMLPDTLWLPLGTGRLSQRVKSEIDIKQAVGPGLEATPASVMVNFEVNELKDLTRYVKVIVLPASPYRFHTSADSVRLVLRMPISQLKHARENLALVAMIDLQKLDVGTHTLLPDIKGLPDFTEVLMADSVTVRKY